ncbi:hypothetical protein KM043_016234 [Ampulex compressa]|nr:hypothetical protein KM043_016234 [Ampulex compressa]
MGGRTRRSVEVMEVGVEYRLRDPPVPSKDVCRSRVDEFPNELRYMASTGEAVQSGKTVNCCGQCGREVSRRHGKRGWYRATYDFQEDRSRVSPVL